MGRPPKCPKARQKYEKLKATPTPVAKKKAAEKEKRAEARREKREAAEQKRRTNAEIRYRKALDSSKKETALRHYRGWSKQELITDAEDYGIRDERRDYKNMSRDQLAVWLYSHQHRQRGMT